MSQYENILDVVKTFLIAGLIDNNVEKLISCLTDDIIGIGMGEQGMVSGLDDIRDVMYSSIKSVKDDITYSLEYGCSNIKVHSNCFCSVCISVIINCNCAGCITKSGLMQSATLRKENDVWKICAIHASPMMLSEESADAYPLRFADNTLARLKTDLQIETLDLINKSISGGIIGIYIEKETCPLYFINDAMLNFLGYSRFEFLNLFSDNVMKITYTDDVENTINLIKESAKTFLDMGSKIRLIKKDGGLIWMIVRGRKAFDEHGREIYISVFTDVTDMVNLQNQLILSEERFRIALAKTSNVIFDYDIVSGNIKHSSVLQKSLDFTTNIKDAKNNLIIGSEISDESLPLFEQAFSMIREGKQQAGCVVKSKLPTGKHIWNKISITGIQDINGECVRAIGMIEDITTQKETELAYERELQYRDAILSDSWVSYEINLTKNQFESCRLNNSLCYYAEIGQIYDDLIIQCYNERIDSIYKQEYLDVFLRDNVLYAYENGKTEFIFDYLVNNSDGTQIFMQNVLRVLPDNSNDIKGFMYVLDIDNKKRKELELKKRSETDTMTELFNKITTFLEITKKLETSDIERTGVFIILDIDHFKSINDTYGHPFGDKILIAVADVLKTTFRETDTIGRIGGDEFCVFCTGMSSKKQIQHTVKTICDRVQEIFIPQTDRAGVSCSIGISMCAGINKTFEEMYKEADKALYIVKNGGRNGFCFA